jgi:indole-3-glycerol phosphate synthase
MPMSRSSVLDRIIAHKSEEIERKRTERPIRVLQSMAQARPPPCGLEPVLRQPGIALIAEVKRQSPSKKIYAGEFDAENVARTYAAHGAAAISVLADEEFFGGGAAIVETVVRTVRGSVPVIYKDFIVDRYQVLEARALGADAVLIVARNADPVRLADNVSLARSLGMDCIVEVFERLDAEHAIAAGARIIGINNRDLSTFEIDIERSGRLRATLPAGILTVSESGLSTEDDIRRAAQLGFDAVLIGEAILAAADVGAKVKQLSRAGRPPAGAMSPPMR